jgi:uncharacterized protein (TIGR02001 family)
MPQASAARRNFAVMLVCSCTSALLSPLPLRAGEVEGSLAATTNYVYRGLSQTQGRPAVQADLHYQSADRWVVGAWASTVDFSRGPGASVEMDLYAAQEWNLNRDWDARIGITHYFYPDDSPRLDYDYDEIAGSLTYQSRLSATIAWSPNVSRFASGWIARHEAATSYEVTASQPLPGRVVAAVGIGYYDLPPVLRADYWFWNIGLSLAVGRAQLGLMYIDTDATAAHAFGYEAAANGWSGSLAWRF